MPRKPRMERIENRGIHCAQRLTKTCFLMNDESPNPVFEAQV